MIEAEGSSLTSLAKDKLRVLAEHPSSKIGTTPKTHNLVFFTLGIKTPGLVDVKHLFYNWAAAPASSPGLMGCRSQSHCRYVTGTGVEEEGTGLTKIEHWTQSLGLPKETKNSSNPATVAHACDPSIGVEASLGV